MCPDSLACRTRRRRFRVGLGALGTRPFPSAGSGSAASTCSTQAYGISPNKCRVEQAFTCATTDGAGTTAWTMVVQQMSPTSVSGTATAQLTHRTLGTCRSTYAMTWTRL